MTLDGRGKEKAWEEGGREVNRQIVIAQGLSIHQRKVMQKEWNTTKAYLRRTIEHREATENSQKRVKNEESISEPSVYPFQASLA